MGGVLKCNKELTMPSKDMSPPAGGKISISDGKLNVPDNPILPFIRGDGTGPDIWAASQRVFDAAVQKAYGGQRKVAWFDEALETPNLGPCRGSGVLIATQAGWKIAQYNLSIPVPNDLVDEFKKRIEDYGKEKPAKKGP